MKHYSKYDRKVIVDKRYAQFWSMNDQAWYMIDYAGYTNDQKLKFHDSRAITIKMQTNNSTTFVNWKEACTVAIQCFVVMSKRYDSIYKPIKLLCLHHKC